jgi:hypothetical protein
MTGALALASTSPLSTWQVIQDGRVAGTPWGVISWNTEPQGDIPADAGFTVEARAADTEAGLGSESFAAVENGVAISIVGRIIQVRVTLLANASDESPILSDLRIMAGDGVTPRGLGISVNNTEAFESDSGSVPATFTIALSEPSDGSVQVDYEIIEASVTAGTDYTPVADTLNFPSGSLQQTVIVSVLGDNEEEEDEEFFLRLSNPVSGELADGLGVGTIFDDDLRIGPVVGQKVTYTLDEDFDQGRLFNIHHDAPLSDQLQVTENISPFPSIWIAASSRGTIVKIDTRTGAILGEYSTTPDNRTRHNPSRTTVALNGSAWAGNRGDGSVIHVGLVEEGQCIDCNGNGVIETSNGYGNVLGWPNGGGVDTQGGVTTTLDECILHYVKVAPSIPRHVSVDADGNIWVSGWGGSNQSLFQLLDGQTGEILRTDGRHPCGGYGGVRYMVGQDGMAYYIEFVISSGCASADKELIQWVTCWSHQPARCGAEVTAQEIEWVVEWSGDVTILNEPPCGRGTEVEPGD